MAKGYWLAHVDVTDAEADKAYIAANARALAKFKARLVRAGTSVLQEGSTRGRNVVIEFADYATALACYQSAEYREAKRLRQHASIADSVIIEGYDGPQPD